MMTGKHSNLATLLKSYKTQPVPKNINPADKQKPLSSELNKKFSKFKSDSIRV